MRRGVNSLMSLLLHADLVPVALQIRPWLAPTIVLSVVVAGAAAIGLGILQGNRLQRRDGQPSDIRPPHPAAHIGTGNAPAESSSQDPDGPRQRAPTLEAEVRSGETESGPRSEDE